MHQHHQDVIRDGTKVRDEVAEFHPDCPYFLKVRLVPMRVAVAGLMNAKRALSRTFWAGFAAISFNLGLGSKRSIWEGAPAMKMKMQALALASKWLARGHRILEAGRGGSLPPSSAEGKRGRLLPVGGGRGESLRVRAGGSDRIHGNKGYSLVMNSSIRA